MTDCAVCRPIDEHGQANRRAARTLREELGNNEPRNGAGTDGEEYNEEHHGHYAHILEPVSLSLQYERDRHHNGQDKHAAETEQMQEATTSFLHQRNRHECHCDHN